MAVKLKFKVAPKRKAGQRAGMSRPTIARAALTMIRDEGIESFTVRKLAARLKVGPTTVRSHFKKGESEIFTAAACAALETISPPYLPNQSAASYLEGVLRSALLLSHACPDLTRLVVAELSKDPLLSLVFAERMSATLSSLLPEVDVTLSLETFICDVSGMLMIESGWALRNSEQAKSDVTSRLKNLSGAEFPMLAKFAETFGVRAETRSLNSDPGARANDVALALIAQLGAAK